MAEDSLVDIIKDISQESTKLSKFLLPTEYVCASCGKTIKGEIPFKIHVTEKCTGKNQKKSTPTPPPPIAPEELKRLLRAQVKHKT